MPSGPALGLGDWFVFWAGLLPCAAVRVGRLRLLRGTLEAIAAPIVLGALVVVVSGY